ncbi:hypothetical protein [Tranquillimonas alkanivorans]|uniref:Phage integrase family protein n=1 Tax=Tranquillimonas alkanivorans TaxID=441119 RepID=A0A1I5VZY2_9RHOB|nr:hypothetical protein [Tranquillimonas alkanivorans]SFQ13074.1 hypothetical protein SAMN04488047_13812 [Tranquillimonas alkanivorans]
MTPIRTFKELEARLPELGYSAAMQKQIRPEIRRAEKIYRLPLERIPVDPAAFEERWGRGRIAALAEGFESHEQFLTFRRRLSPALQRAAGLRRNLAPPMPSASTELLRFVDENGGVNAPLPPHLEQSIGALSRAAARTGLAIRDLDDRHVAAIFRELTGGERRSARRGVLRVNELMDRRDEFPDIADLLPARPLAPVARAVAPKSPWARSNRHERGARLWSEFARFVEDRRGRDELGRLIPPKKSKFGLKAEKSYANYLASALALLADAGRLGDGADPGLRDICNAKTIEEIAHLWNVRQLNGEVKKKATTLHTMVCRLSNLAEHFGAKKKERKALAKLRKQVRKASGRVGKMRIEHVDWVRSFAANPGLQRAVFDMPETLKREADAILARWDEHKRAKRQKLMMRALKLGVAACAAAILFRASPVRAANLRHLKFRGGDTNLPRNEDGDLRVSIPGEDVKNRAEIDHPADDDVWPIIDWYLKEIRPRLIADHPYLRKRRLPLVDSDYLFPSTSEDRPLEETAFAKHYAAGCEAVGLRMCLHLARHITVYLILSEDPNAWAQAAAVLEDEIDTVKKHYAWLDTRAAGEEGRKLLRASRARARKHRKGADRHAA